MPRGKKPVAKAATKTTKKSTTKKTAVKAAAKKPVKKTTAKKVVKKNDAALPTTAIKEKQTKLQIINDIAAEMDLDKKTTAKFFDVLKNHIDRHIKKRGSGDITIPGLGIKVKRVEKAATKKRKGRNPLTGEEVMIAAKPKRSVVKVSALKVLKEVLEK